MQTLLSSRPTFEFAHEKHHVREDETFHVIKFFIYLLSCRIEEKES